MDAAAMEHLRPKIEAVASEGEDVVVLVDVVERSDVPV